jgi:hypothetical protein
MRKSYWILAIILVLLSIPVLWYVQNNDPLTTSYYPKCIFHALTGLHCPGCGSTRAAHALLNGNVLAAIAWNPFLILIVPGILAAVFYDQRLQRQGRQGIQYLSRIVLILVVAFFILRNIPSPQNGWLAPLDIQSSPIAHTSEK